MTTLQRAPMVKRKIRRLYLLTAVRSAVLKDINDHLTGISTALGFPATCKETLLVFGRLEMGAPFGLSAIMDTVAWLVKISFANRK